jgi:AcrR family transcriptional regulator
MPRPLDPDIDRAITGTTLKLLRERGFARMSVEAVASEAGVGKPAIYRRHADKAELVTAAIRSILPVLDEPDTGSTRGDLVSLAQQARGMTEGPFARLLGTVLAEQDRQPEVMEAFRERIVAPRREMARRVVKRGMERGEVRADLDVEQALDAFAGNIIGRHVVGLPFDDAWFEAAIEFFWRGIRA